MATSGFQFLRERYAQQLRTDSIYLFIPVSLLIPLLASFAPYINAEWPQFILTSSLYNENTGWVLLVLFNLVVGGLISRVSWRLAQREQSVASGSVLIVGHVLLLAVMLSLFWSPGSYLAYLFAFFVGISSTALRPQASLSIWMLSVGMMVLATAVWLTESNRLAPQR